MSSISRLGPTSALAYAIVAVILCTPVQANELDMPLECDPPSAKTSDAKALGYSSSQQKQPHQDNAISVVSSILAGQAMYAQEPGIGAAVPSAAASYGTLTAAQQANAQLAASALAHRALINTHSQKLTALSKSENKNDGSAFTQPKVFVNAIGASNPSTTKGLTINIELPNEVLQPDAKGNPQNITINLSFPENQAR